MKEVILHEQSLKDWSLAGVKPRCFRTHVPKWKFCFFGGLGSTISKGQGYIKEVIEVLNPFQRNAYFKSHSTLSHTTVKWNWIVKLMERYQFCFVVLIVGIINGLPLLLLTPLHRQVCCPWAGHLAPPSTSRKVGTAILLFVLLLLDHNDMVCFHWAWSSLKHG